MSTQSVIKSFAQTRKRRRDELIPKAPIEFSSSVAQYSKPVVVESVTIDSSSSVNLAANTSNPSSAAPSILSYFATASPVSSSTDVSTSFHSVPSSSAATESASREAVKYDLTTASLLADSSSLLGVTSSASRNLSTIPPSPGVSLPISLSILSSHFDSLEVAMSVRELTTTTFHSIKRSVEIVYKKAFELSHLLQIAYLYPEAYSVVRTTERNDHGKEVVDYKITRHNECIAETPYETVRNGRRATFKDRLMSYVISAHEKFLQNLPKSEQEAFENANASGSDLGRWHPMFRVDSIDPIPQVQLSEGDKRITSTKRGSLSALLNRQVPLPFSTVSTCNDDALSSASSTPTSSSSLSSWSSIQETPDEQIEIAGLSSAFLIRARQRMADRQSSRGTQFTPAQWGRLSLLSRLAKLVDIVSYIFDEHSGDLILVDELVRKCSGNADFTNLVDTRNALSELMKIAPDYFTERLTGVGQESRKAIGWHGRGRLDEIKTLVKDRRNVEEQEMILHGPSAKRSLSGLIANMPSQSQITASSTKSATTNTVSIPTSLMNAFRSTSATSQTATGSTSTSRPITARSTDNPVNRARSLTFVKPPAPPTVHHFR